MKYLVEFQVEAGKSPIETREATSPFPAFCRGDYVKLSDGNYQILSVRHSFLSDPAIKTELYVAPTGEATGTRLAGGSGLEPNWP